MTNIISQLIQILETLSQKIPLELFTILGSFIEEIIAPIPSPFVLTLVGTITKAQDKALIYILVIAVIASLSKTLAGWILYFITDKAEDVVVGKFGKFFGISHDDIEKIGSNLSGSWKDVFILFALRSIPVMPSSPISITCGAIKFNLNKFLISTFFGSIIRSIFFLYLGYSGLAASESISKGIDSGETIGKIVFLVILFIALLWGYKKRKENKLPWQKQQINNSDSKSEEAKRLLSYKEVPELPKKESDTKPTLYIFRHGQTEDNANFIFSGWRDSPLTEIGKEQAKVLSEKLKDKKINMLISSPQIRAIETMKIAISLNEDAKSLDIIKDDRIKERSYGDYQGKSKLEIQLSDPDKLKQIRRSYDFLPPNGESLEMVCKRVEDFCLYITKKMKEENINVAVSCHGNSIRGFRKYFENLNPEETSKVETPLAQDYAAYVIE